MGSCIICSLKQYGYRIVNSVKASKTKSQIILIRVKVFDYSWNCKIHKPKIKVRDKQFQKLSLFCLPSSLSVPPSLLKLQRKLNYPVHHAIICWIWHQQTLISGSSFGNFSHKEFIWTLHRSSNDMDHI